MITQIMLEDFSKILSDNTIDWKIFEDKTVLITGGSGFLASYMLLTLLTLNKRLEKKCKVISLVRNLQKAQNKFSSFLSDPNFVLVEHDISEPYKTQLDIDFIIHAASNASPKFFYSDPVGTISANSLGTHYMLSLAKEKSVESFLFFSTGEVCGDIFEKMELPAENDYGVIDPLDIRSSYAESKRMGECMCSAYNHQYGVPVKIIRPSHTYGPGFQLDDGRVFASFVADVLNDRDIVLKSDGTASRSFCYLADATRAYFKVLLDGKNGHAYNVANSYSITILELAETIIKASGKKINISFDYNKENQSSPINHIGMDVAKIKSLGWMPEVNEAEGFKRTLLSYLEK